MIDLQGIDSRISEITREIDFYSYLTPLNQKEEMDKFVSCIKKGEAYNPGYEYKDAKYFYQEEWLKKTRSSLDGNDLLHSLFIKKIDFISSQLELISCGDDDLTGISSGLYGMPDEACLRAARDILVESRDQGYEFPEETVTPEELVSILQKDLEGYGIEWKVVLSKKIVPKVTVSGRDRTIYINASIDYTIDEIERLKVHEVQVHIFRGANGHEQPYKIFSEGLADYNETEEGLAIVSEEITGVHNIDTRQLKLYSGRAICVEQCLKGSFYEAYTAMCEFFPDYIAYRLVERVKRGLKDTSRPGCITKGFHYISGWKKMQKYVEEGGDLGILYVGKIGLRDLDTVRSLLEGGVLKEPKYLPEFVKER